MNLNKIIDKVLNKMIKTEFFKKMIKKYKIKKTQEEF